MLLRLKIVTSVLFVIVAIAICLFWARSNKWTDTLTCHPHGISPFYIESTAGRLGCGFADKSERDYPRFFAVAHTPIHEMNAIRAAMDQQLYGAAGFGLIPGGNTEFVVPDWFAAVLAVAVAALPWSRMTRRLGARLAISLLISLVTLLGAIVWLDRAWSAK